MRSDPELPHAAAFETTPPAPLRVTPLAGSRGRGARCGWSRHATERGAEPRPGLRRHGAWYPPCLPRTAPHLGCLCWAQATEVQCSAQRARPAPQCAPHPSPRTQSRRSPRRCRFYVALIESRRAVSPGGDAAVLCADECGWMLLWHRPALQRLEEGAAAWLGGAQVPG